MIKDAKTLKKFEDHFIASDDLSHEQSRRLFSAMWEEGVKRGAIPSADPLEGIDVDIRVARILNSCSTKHLHR